MSKVSQWLPHCGSVIDDMPRMYLSKAFKNHKMVKNMAGNFSIILLGLKRFLIEYNLEQCYIFQLPDLKLFWQFYDVSVESMNSHHTVLLCLLV